jgi:cytoskeleton protein RodZ
MPMSTESSVDASVSPGERLRKARISYSWTIEDVAGNLNLSIDVIHALESGDYAGLPEPAFIRGYLRAYARLMEIDEKLILTEDRETAYGRLGSVVPVMENSALLESNRRKSWLRFSKKNKSIRRRPIIVGILVIAAILAVWWLSGIRPADITGSTGGSEDSGTKTITVPLKSTAND